MKQINIRLDDTQLNLLNSFGGHKKGVVALIDEHLQKMETRDPNPEQKFFDCLYLPSEKNLKATYTAFLNAYISKGNLAGTIGAYINKLMGETGYDEATTRKHFRKLAGSGFIKPMLNMLFRPTLRLRDTTTKDEFKKILETYSLFIQGSAEFTDFWDDGEELAGAD